MTVNVPEPVAHAADVNESGVVAKATDEAEKHTPEHVHVEAPREPEVTNPADAGKDRIDVLTDIVAGLATTVTTLTEAVAGIVNKDDAPHTVPWTHRGGHRE